MNEIFCHFCNKEVELIAYGGGWIGICCDRVLYNSSERPQHKTKVVQLMHEKIKVDCEDLCGS
jgi:hypothetical protein